MNDIERAIKQFKEWEKDRWRLGKSPSIPTLILARQALEKQLNGGWISVSEKLPKEDEEVLITLAHGKATWAYLHQGEWNTMFSTYPIERVIAWQPLPEPYKEEENE